MHTGHEHWTIQTSVLSCYTISRLRVAHILQMWRLLITAVTEQTVPSKSVSEFSKQWTHVMLYSGVIRSQQTKCLNTKHLKFEPALFLQALLIFPYIIVFKVLPKLLSSSNCNFKQVITLQQCMPGIVQGKQSFFI